MTQKEKILRRLALGPATRRDLCKMLQATNNRVDTVMNTLVHNGAAIKLKNTNQPTWCRPSPSKASLIPWLRPSGMRLVRDIEAGLV